MCASRRHRALLAGLAGLLWTLSTTGFVGAQPVVVDAGEGAREPLQLDPVEVDAGASEVGPPPTAERRVDAIGADELERHGVTTLAEALARLSAAAPLDATNTASGLIVDGLPAGQLMVLRDGVPISRPQGSPSGPLVDLNSLDIDPERIERIEIYRGGGPAGSGVSSAVTINIVTRREARPLAAWGRAQLGSELSALADHSYAAGVEGQIDSSWSARARTQVALQAPLDVNGDATFDISRALRANGEVGTVWQRGRDASLALDVAGGWSEVEALGAEIAPLYDRVRTARFDAVLDGRWRALSRLQITHATRLAWFGHDFAKVVRSSDFVRPKSDTDAFTLRQSVAGTWRFDDHDLGGELVLDGARVTRSGETGELDPVHEGRATLGVSEDLFVVDWMTVHGRVLGDLSTAFGADVSAELDVGFHPHEAVTLRVGGSRTRRLPTAEERFLSFDHSEVGYRIVGNDALEPETTWSARAGVGVGAFDGLLSVEVDGFYNHLTDLIDSVAIDDDVAGVATFTWGNRARAHTAGMNVAVRLSDLPGGLSLLGQYAWLPLYEDLDSGAALELRAEHAGRAELSGRWLDGLLRAWIDLGGRSERTVPAGAVAAPGHALLGAGVGVRPVDGLDLTVDADNLLDQRNATWGPRPGLHLLFTIAYRYTANEDTP